MPIRYCHKNSQISQLFSEAITFLVQCYDSLVLKVAFIQKVLIYLLYPQPDERNYFPELEFLNCVNLNSNHVSEAALKAQIGLYFAI